MTNNLVIYDIGIDFFTKPQGRYRPLKLKDDKPQLKVILVSFSKH